MCVSRNIRGFLSEAYQKLIERIQRNAPILWKRHKGNSLLVKNSYYNAQDMYWWWLTEVLRRGGHRLNVVVCSGVPLPAVNF